MNHAKPPITTNATIAQRVPFESSWEDGDPSSCAEAENARTPSTEVYTSLGPIRIRKRIKRP